MEDSRRAFYQSLLHREIAPALGCTEPAAAALTAACAAACLGQIPEEITVKTSQYILKNAMNVGIPGIGMTGLDIAVALGALSARPKKELMILSHISAGEKRMAKALTEQGKVRIELAPTEEKIYIEVQVRAGSETAKAVTAETACSRCPDSGLCGCMSGADTGGDHGKDKPVYLKECHECGNSGDRYDGAGYCSGSGGIIRQT